MNQARPTTGPIPKDRAPNPLPRPAGQVTRPAPKAAPAPQPAPRSVGTQTTQMPPAPPQRRRGAPTKAERAAALAAEIEPQPQYEEQTDVIEGQEGEGQTDPIYAEQAHGVGEDAPIDEADADYAEPEVEPAPAPKHTRPSPAPRPQQTYTNPKPVPPTTRPATRPVAAPRTAAEHRSANGGQVRGGAELAKRHTTAIQNANHPQQQQTSALKGDILIPRILLMQGSSQLVKDRKAQVGDIVRSGNGERLGGSTGPDSPAEAVDVIPLALSQSWTIMSGDGKTFLGTEPRDASNDAFPWEFVDQATGEEKRRLKTIDAIVMVAQDIERIHGQGGVEVDEEGIPLDLDSSVILPHAVSFKSTGFTAGKGVSTFFARVEALMKTHPLTRPYHFTLPLTCTVDSDSENEWYVFEVGTAKRTKSELVPESKTWFETVATKKYVLQDEASAEQSVEEAITQPRQF